MTDPNQGITPPHKETTTLSQPSPTDDPVEWAENEWKRVWDSRKAANLLDQIIRPLAQRCREAEARANKPFDPEPLRKMVETLAQANANADKWRTKALMWRKYLRQANKGAANNSRALQLMAHTSGHHWQTIQELRTQLAAAQERITALNSENNTLASLMMDETRDKNAAQARVAELEEIIRQIPST